LISFLICKRPSHSLGAAVLFWGIAKPHNMGQVPFRQGSFAHLSDDWRVTPDGIAD